MNVAFRAFRWQFLLFPPACWRCGRLLNPLASAPPGFPYLCAACHGALGWRDPARCCAGCGRPTAEPRRLRCPACPPEAPAWGRVAAPFAYGDPVRRWILNLKYHRHDPLAPMLGALLARAMRSGALLEGVDWVAPVPLHPSRIRGRGFNQAHLLAHHALAALRREGLAPPALRTDLLRRHRRTRPQVELPAAERRANVADAFSVPPRGEKGWRAWIDGLRFGNPRQRGGQGAHPGEATDDDAGDGAAGGAPADGAREAIAGRHILLVDDVMTSGATLDACARTLRQAGARRVDAIVLARA